MMTPTTALAAWENFYIIIGSAGGALIGLQFVVITLIADKSQRLEADSLGAFATPTVVHFTGVLILSTIMSVPWPTLTPLAIAVAICGICGVAYSTFVLRRTRRQKTYQPVWQDWLWYGVLPCGVGAALAVAALFLQTHTQPAMLATGAAALGLLLIGIHNAWDTVTHIVISNSRDELPTND